MTYKIPEDALMNAHRRLKNQDRPDLKAEEYESTHDILEQEYGTALLPNSNQMMFLALELRAKSLNAGHTEDYLFEFILNAYDDLAQMLVGTSFPGT